jgi:hypothetical protein
MSTENVRDSASGSAKHRRCSDAGTERISLRSSERVTMLPIKGLLDEDLALDLVMDALRGKHEGGYVFTEFKGSQRREPSSAAPRTRQAGRLTLIDGGKGV